MNRFIVLFLLSFVLLFSGCVRHSQVKYGLIDQTKLQTIAIVETVQGETQVGCSGVWIGPKTILTARHCVNGVAQAQYLEAHRNDEDFMMLMLLGGPEFQDDDLVGIEVKYSSEDELPLLSSPPIKFYLSKTIAVSKEKDLAILTAEGDVPRHVSAPIVAEAPRAGTDLTIIGHPHGLTYTYMRGYVSSEREDEPTGERDILGPFVQVVAPVWFGNSGGGAFDSHGCLVGIASFIVKAPNEAFFVHPNTIKKFLEENEQSYATYK